MQSRDQRLYYILNYIDGDKFNASNFTDTYKIDEFNHEEKASIAERLFVKAKSSHRALKGATGDLIKLDIAYRNRPNTHWYNYFSDKKKLKNFEKDSATALIRALKLIQDTLQLAIEYGSEAAKLYKLENNIGNSNRTGVSPNR
jgi:hypothetical protein